MYKVKLIKGLSYTGAVHATKREPYAEVKEKETADALIASGYFVLVEAAETDGATESGKNKTKKATKKKEAAESDCAADYGEEE